ncbi:single-stranded DNA-binding protein [Candidatus Gracilibacteria bacterium]|nr:single-stranded DNA-binding protein [Candidatus Gracilibacteria bacterium]
MRTVNKVILIGNITKDPIIKTTEGGKKVALYNIATNRYYKTTDGEQKSESEFHNCVAWGALADQIEKFVTKGKLVYLEGRLKTRVIEKEGGERIYKTEVVTGNIIFLNKRSDFDEAGISQDDTNILDIDSDDKF